MNKKKLKDAAINGTSSAVGAAAGFVATSAIAQDSHTEESTFPTTSEAVETPGQDYLEGQEPEQSKLEPAIEEEHIEEGTVEDQLEVLGVETVTLEDGIQVDVAHLQRGDTEAVVVDIDRDGSGDLLMVDTNHNGQVDEGEVLDVRGEGFDMAAYAEAVPQSEVQVVDAGTITMDDGSQVDAVLLSDGRNQALVVDMDQEGTADFALIDRNGDGHISEDEVVDLRGEDICMSGFTGQEDDSMLAQNDDYVNDANVDNF